MICYITPNDILATLPIAFDAANCDVIRLTTDSEPTINCQYTVDVEYDSSDQPTYYVVIDLHQFDADFTISIADKDETLTTTVHVPVFDYTKFDNWLSLQGLDYVIPVLKKLGWSKLKQCANIARKLSTMQGTEYALSAMLSLLDAKDAVVLKRKWSSVGDEPAEALDILRSSQLAKRGFVPTGSAVLQYQRNALDSWKRQVYAKSAQVALDIDDIVTCLRHVLPATIRLTDWQVVQVALACIYSNYAIASTECYDSESIVGNDIDCQSTTTYVHQNAVRDWQSKALIRFASKTDHAYDGLVALLQIKASQPVVDATVSIDDKVFARCLSFDKTVTLVVQEDDNVKPGQHMLKIGFSNDNGVHNEYTYTVDFKPCNDHVDICTFEDAGAGTATAIPLHSYGLVRLVKQYTNCMYKLHSSAKHATPKSYLRFFIDADDIADLYATTHKYLHVQEQCIPCRIDSLLALTDFDIEFKVVNDKMTAMLTTKQFCGLFGMSMHISDTPQAALIEVPRQALYMSDTVKPFITITTLQMLRTKLHADAFMNCTVNDENLGYIQNAEDLSIWANKAINVNKHDGVPRSISVDAGQLNFSATTVPTIDWQDRVQFHAAYKLNLTVASRPASCILVPASDIRINTVYAAYKQDCMLSLYIIKRGERYRLQCDSDSLVFCLATAGHYQLTIESDYYYKLIDILV